jgi:hypothetical protein
MPSLRTYALVQFAVMIAANQHFLTTFPNQGLVSNALYFAVILAGLTTASIALAGRSEFFAAEPARLLTIAAGVMATGTWLGGVRSPAIVTVIVVYAFAALAWFAVLWRRAGRERLPVPARNAITP